MIHRQKRSYRDEPHPLTGFLSMLLFIALVPAIFVVPVERVLFQPATYNQAVAAQQPDRRMVEIFADLVTREPDELDPQMVRSVETMSRAELEDLFASVLPVGWAQNQSNRVVEGLLAYLNGRQSELSMPVDMTPLKNSLDAHSQEMAVGIVASWPPCTAETLLQMGVDAINGALTEIPYCHPGEVLRPLVERLMSGSIRFTASSLPAAIDLAGAFPQAGRPGWWVFYRLVRSVILVSPQIALFFVVLILVLSGVQSSGAWRAIGQAFLLASLAAVVLAGIGALVFTPVVGFVLDGPFFFLPDFVDGFLIRVLQVAGLRLGLSVVVWSALAAVIGLTLLVAAMIVRRQSVMD